jgi:hypothetical protein
MRRVPSENLVAGMTAIVTSRLGIVGNPIVCKVSGKPSFG